jgi:2-phospho-L-lactate/phosphoenolpyruvate guanylyltransferase
VSAQPTDPDHPAPNRPNADHARPGGADLAVLHVVLPLRTLAGGKARLGEALDAEEREALVAGMLRHELAVVADWGRAAAVHVVTLDPALMPLAQAGGARSLLQVREGLNDAIREACVVARASGASALLVLPGDLPLLDVAALERLLEAADAALAAGAGAPLVVLAPADARDGTNALLLSPPDVIEPAFGPRSLELHARAARDAGASLQLVVDPALGFDLDTPQDLDRLEPQRLAELEALGAAVTPA